MKLETPLNAATISHTVPVRQLTGNRISVIHAIILFRATTVVVLRQTQTVSHLINCVTVTLLQHRVVTL